jgi:putative addiction module killer protein
MRLIVREYLTADGRSPWRAWLDELDVSTRARVQARVLRFESGNLGDHKALGDGLWEARLFFGPGYRIYFSRHEGALVLLLAGGDKGSQSRDIRRARQHLADYLEAQRHGKA